MDIKEIKQKTELIQQLNARSYALVKEVAKSMKVQDVDLMQFINDNPKLFYVEIIYKYKTKNVTRYVSPFDKNTKYNESVSVKDGVIGKGIKFVYNSAVENWRTEEWLAMMIEKNKTHIAISQWDNYGHIEGLYVSLSQIGEMRKHIYLNTPEKLEQIRSFGLLKKATFFIGGFGDCSSHQIDTAINHEGLESLKELGWTYEII